MYVYKDKTFCINENCKKRCDRYLTEKIKKKIKEGGLLVSVSEFSCTDKGDIEVSENG